MNGAPGNPNVGPVRNRRRVNLIAVYNPCVWLHHAVPSPSCNRANELRVRVPSMITIINKESRMSRFTLVLLATTALAGCASQNRYLIDESSSPSIQQASAAPTLLNTSVPGARPIVLSASGGPVSGPRAYNSDNRPTSSRTGLNSDPDNPNGVPQ
jgi:hypothetical protein